jgi:putative lipoprotein
MPLAAFISPAAAQETTVRTSDSWLARDKASHLAISCSLVGFGYHLARFEGGEERGRARAASVSLALGLGIIKEFCDQGRPSGRFSYKDLVFDLAGAGLGLMIFTTNK